MGLLDSFRLDGKVGGPGRPDYTVMRAGRDLSARCEAAPRFRVA